MDTATELKLETSRVINASPEVLYDAWLDPSMLAKFMRPGPDMSVPEVKADARVGGRFLIVMRVGDQDLPHEGTYKVLDRPNQLAFTCNPLLEPNCSRSAPLREHFKEFLEEMIVMADLPNDYTGTVEVI